METAGSDVAALCTDLEAALAELVRRAGEERWDRGRPGKWTAGQHVAHVGLVLSRTAERFEHAERALRAGTPPPAPPRRGPLQWLWVRLVATRGLPRGGRTAPPFVPGGRPPREATLAALWRDAGRHRALGGRLDPASRDRLWIPNPFSPRWHYRLPEMVRVHAVHARHHARLVAEIAGRD